MLQHNKLPKTALVRQKIRSRSASTQSVQDSETPYKIPSCQTNGNSGNGSGIRGS